MKLRDAVPAEERRFGYLTTVEGIQLDEDSDLSWLHAAPLGVYKHPLYGKIDFTLDKIQRFAQNLKARVRGIDIAIDYSHRASDKAAGWVRDAEARNDGLWLLVEWTRAAADSIRNKEFKYFSPEFVDSYKDPKTNTVYKDVLLGGGLTNRPFLKDLIPVNLSEVFSEEEENSPPEPVIEQEDHSVNEFLDKLRKQMGLPEDAPEDQILASVGTVASEEDSAQMSELISQNRQLSEQVAQLVAAQRLTEVNYQLREWERGEDAEWALPPALHESVKDILLNSPKKFSEKVSTIFDELLKTGLVHLKEIGSAKTLDELPVEDTIEEENEATAKFNDLVEKILEENPDMEIGDAVEEAARRDEQLFEEYRQSTYTFREDD